jgi:hypothetical protein
MRLGSDSGQYLRLTRLIAGSYARWKDAHGGVYTPQPLVQFMIASVEHVLGEHFDTTLGAQGVHIFDPFTGTGDFIVNILQPEHLPGSALRHKYLHELHCNEVSLLPGIRPLLRRSPDLCLAGRANLPHFQNQGRDRTDDEEQQAGGQPSGRVDAGSLGLRRYDGARNGSRLDSSAPGNSAR